MVNKIYELKNRLIDQIEKDMGTRGTERMDPQMVDMVKDLAEAEKDCWEAEYYRSVTEAMGGQSGYSPEHMPMGYQQGRPTWQNQYGPGYRRGYMGYDGMSGHGDSVEGIRNIMNMAGPEEKERIKAELRSMM